MTVQHGCELTEDQIDDLLYFARSGETQTFAECLAEVKAASKCSEVKILLVARDEHSGNSVLHMACANGHLDTAKKILSLLPPPTAPDAPPHSLVSCRNSSGNTALHWASLNGHLPIVQALVLTANADPTLTNSAGHDATYEAEINDKKDIVEWLLSHCESLEETVADETGEGNEAGGEAPESKDEAMGGV